MCTFILERQKHLTWCCHFGFFLVFLSHFNFKKSKFQLFVGSRFALFWAIVHFKVIVTVVPIKAWLIKPYLMSRRDGSLPFPTPTSGQRLTRRFGEEFCVGHVEATWKQNKTEKNTFQRGSAIFVVTNVRSQICYFFYRLRLLLCRC